MTMWMLQSGDGKYLYGLSAKTRRDLIELACRHFNTIWATFEAAGYRATKVRVTEERKGT